jgi:hypothetical protein
MKKKIFIILSIQIIIYWFAFDFLRWVEFDTPSYISGARYLFQLSGGADIQSRISKPFVLLLPGIFEKAFHIHPVYIFVLQNVLAFYACGFLVYAIMKHIYNKNIIALSGMIMFTTCQVFAIFSLFVISDVIAWFFILLLIYLSLQTNKTSKTPYFKSLSIGIIAFVGVFSKENAVVGILFFIFYILFSNYNFVSKIKLLSIALVPFLILSLTGLLILEHTFGTSIISRLSDTRAYYDRVYYRLSDISQFYRVFDVFWVIFFISVPHILKQLFFFKNQVILATTATLMTTIILLPIHPFVSDRILFTIAPFLIILSGAGLMKLLPFSLFFIVAGGLINIIVAWSIYFFNIKGLLYGTFLFYTIVITGYIFYVRSLKSLKNGS